MSTSLTTTYLLPAILLNPVLFLHSLNTILARLLPPVLAATAVEPQSYSKLGPPATSPHLDMHVNDNLCWSYTVVMVFAQLLAFGRVSQRRQTIRERDEALSLRRGEGPDSKHSYFDEMDGGAPPEAASQCNGRSPEHKSNGVHGDWRLEQRNLSSRPDSYWPDETDGTGATTEEEMML